MPDRNMTAEVSQRDRLVAAMIELSARDGYQGVSVTQITTHAGVSSATFYELFSDKEDCALAAYRASTGRMLADMEPIDPDAVAGYEDWSQAAVAGIRRLLDAVCADTDSARLLLVESLGGGPRVREERRAVTGVFQSRARAMLAATPPEAPRIDLPPVALIGAIRTIVSRHLRMSSEDQLPELAEDLVSWLRSYGVSPGRTLWSTGPRARLRASRHSAPPPAPEPKRLPRGRHRLPPSVVARSHRTRIIHATAQATREKGYADATVTDIVSAAGVSRQVFYEHFADKHQAFLEAQHYPAQHIFDRCAAAYFAPAPWPERIWNGLRALLELVVVHPSLSHLRLVECYAAGPAAIRRAEEVTRSFTIFFEEGFVAGGERDERSRIFSQAITGAIFEIIQRHAARDELELLPLLLPQLTYIAIAPFIGAETAIETIGGLVARNTAERPIGREPGSRPS
ncbi:MAG TPA: TetR/AcrR family transcriptional regulator [Solirubrobacteraceae bacterium]|nr:TetR/AcrR family transcriptional regulator [Solirubrobacteraceae bacterium]